MTIKVIGTGFGRTGTSSLKNALEQLGFGKCYHMFEVFQNPGHIPVWTEAAHGRPVDWAGVFEGYQSICDWPGSAVWRELAAAYPAAKFIHTQRPEDAWLKSFKSTIQRGVMGEAEGPPGWAAMARAMINDRVFGGRADDDEVCLAAYRRNLEEVTSEIPASKLLVFDPKDGWAPLCAFLGVPVPAQPYPHDNTTEQFQARMAARGAT
jgi:hypothetical protein